MMYKGETSDMGTVSTGFCDDKFSNANIVSFRQT